MHRALSIPEILLQIFRNLDKPSNANNARVCRAWINFALDQVWRVVDLGVFRSLAPMVPSSEDEDLLVGSQTSNRLFMY